MPLHVVERDYALSYVLAGIGEHATLGRVLAFKGGTALKKIYFRTYRFSEDLDFTLLENIPPDDIARYLQDAVEQAQTLARAYSPIEMTVAPKRHRDPHPRGQQDFAVSVRFPWHHHPQCAVKVEITRDEPIITPPVRRTILHGYSHERFDATVKVYTVEEIIAEKLRTLLQTHEQMKMKGWATRRGRDYYDLWRLLSAPHLAIDAGVLPALLRKKCAARKVSYTSPDDFFHRTLQDDARRHWETSLRDLVPDLPPFDRVIAELRRHLDDLSLVD